jgi:hypothetical protein
VAAPRCAGGTPRPRSSPSPGDGPDGTCPRIGGQPPSSSVEVTAPRDLSANAAVNVHPAPPTCGLPGSCPPTRRSTSIELPGRVDLPGLVREYGGQLPSSSIDVPPSWKLSANSAVNVHRAHSTRGHDGTCPRIRRSTPIELDRCAAVVEVVRPRGGQTPSSSINVPPSWELSANSAVNIHPAPPACGLPGSCPLTRAVRSRDRATPATVRGQAARWRRPPSSNQGLRKAREERFWFVLYLPPGNAEDALASGHERGVAQSISLERRRR